MNQRRSGIKFKIMIVTGSVIALIMMTISLSILFQWRAVIIEKQITNSESVANAFSIPVLDALIYAEQEDLQKEYLLETYIDNYMAKVDGIKYISIIDNNLQVLAHSNRKEFNKILSDPVSKSIIKTKSIITSIFFDNNLGWIIETASPLQIGGKRWGIAKIGFDAEPIRKQIRNIFFLLFALTGVVTFGTLFVLYILINRITSSLNKLVVEVDKLDFDSENSFNLPESNDEIGFLVFHFNKLKKRLSLSKQQLAKAQQQIFQSEKLASIGRLASGVAHEINNPLNGIKNCLYAIHKEPENKEQTKEYLALINEGMDYIENVIQKLLGFARQQSKSIEVINLNDLILKVVRLLEYKLKQKRIKLTLELDDELPGFKADSQLIQEVIMNLLMNSIDAILENGKIVIASGFNEEKKIKFSVSDNGMGISQEEIQNIFDPFYTTKEPGVGTGLGLSVSLGIIEQHGGKITVESRPDIKTIFTVIMPFEGNDESTIN